MKLKKKRGAWNEESDDESEEEDEEAGELDQTAVEGSDDEAGSSNRDLAQLFAGFLAWLNR